MAVFQGQKCNQPLMRVPTACLRLWKLFVMMSTICWRQLFWDPNKTVEPCQGDLGVHELWNVRAGVVC